MILAQLVQGFGLLYPMLAKWYQFVGLEGRATDIALVVFNVLDTRNMALNSSLCLWNTIINAILQLILPRIFQILIKALHVVVDWASATVTALVIPQFCHFGLD